MLATAIVLGLTAVASATDLRWHKIYNWTTYPGVLAGFGLSALGTLLLATDAVSVERLSWLGWLPLKDSLSGFAACGAIMLVVFVFFRGVGGGDVKLMAMLGALLGVEDGLQTMLMTFVLGACLALSVLIWRIGPGRLLVRLARQVVWSLRLRGWSSLSPEERAQLQPPLFLAPCALAAVILVRGGLLDYLPL